MKNLKLNLISLCSHILLFFILLSGNILAQEEPFDKPPKRDDKIKELHKQYIIEKLKIDETTANKIFEVQEKHRKNLRELRQEKKSIMETIKNDPNSPDVKEKLDDILNLEYKMIDLRKDLFEDLNTILSPNQIAQMMIADQEFMKKLNSEIKKHKKKRKPRDDREPEDEMRPREEQFEN